MDINIQLRNIRKEKGLTQKDIAKKMGVNQQMVSKIESGHTTLASLNKYAKALDCKIEAEVNVSSDFCLNFRLKDKV